MTKYLIYDGPLNTSNYTVSDALPADMIPEKEIEFHIDHLAGGRGYWYTESDGSRTYDMGATAICEVSCKDEVAPGLIFVCPKEQSTAFAPVGREAVDDDCESELEIVGYVPIIDLTNK